MSAEELIDILEKRALLSPAVIGNLRKFVAKSLKIVTPDSLAKLLVERGLLTQVQAKQLFEPAPSKAGAQDDDLSLAPLDDPNALKQAKLVQPPTSKARPAAAGKKPAAKSSAAPIVAAASPAASAAKAASAPKPAKPAAKPNSKPAAVEKQVETSLFGAGPLDDLLGDAVDGSGPGGFDSGPLAPARRRSNIQTPIWMWVAAGILLAAFVVGLTVALGRSNGDVEWQLAEKDFSTGADAEAIAKLDAFLAKFPNHPRAGAADVYRNIARLRQAAASKTDSLNALAIAREVLPKVVDQPDFPKAREGLSKLLPELAARVVKQAKDGAKASLDQRRNLAEAAVEAVALAKDPRYTPDSRKPWAALESAESEAALLMRAVDRQTELERATGEIHSAAATGNLTAAFEGRDRLLARFPELQAEDFIGQFDQELAQAEAKAPKVDHQRHRAEAKPRPTPIVSTTVLAATNDRPAAGAISNHAGGVTRPINAMPIRVPVKFQSPGLSAHAAAASPSGSTIAIFAKGTAYWVNSSDGKPLGRRFLGFDSFNPTPIEPLDRSEFIAYDAGHQELTLVKAEMAAVVWRQTLGAPLAGEPAIRGTTLHCTTRAGRLSAIDLDSGDIIGSIQLAEPLGTSPTVSSDGLTLYLVGDCGNLFALDAKDFRFKGATRLGINRGAIWLAPIEIGKYLVIVDNSDPDQSSLRVIATTAEGSLKTAQQISLAGRVSTPPLADGQRLFVVTDRGEVSVFAASGPATAPLVKIAGRPPDSTADRKPRFLALQDNRLFVGGGGLAAYDAVGGGNLRPLWQRLADESVIAAPSILAGSLVVATRRPDVPGVVVRGINSASGEPKWETIIGAPLAGQLLVDPDGKTLEAVHPWAGIVRQESVGTAPQEFIAAPVVKINGKRPMPAIAAAPFGSQQVALVGVNGSGSQRPPEMRLLFADRRSGNLEASPWRHALACTPVALDENVVVADQQGEIFLFSGSRDASIASPFITPMPGDSDSPAVVSMAAGKSEIVVTDGRQRIFCLELKTDPSNRFVLRAEEPLTRAIASPIAMAGRLIFTDDETGEITARNVADLKPFKSWPLGSRLQWGPVVAGEIVLAATDRELVCFDSKPELIWRKPLPAGVPVGTARVRGADLVLASMTGTVWAVDRKSGEAKKSIDLGEPLASGPVPFDKHWAIAAADGSLLFVVGW